MASNWYLGFELHPRLTPLGRKRLNRSYFLYFVCLLMKRINSNHVGKQSGFIIRKFANYNCGVREGSNHTLSSEDSAVSKGAGRQAAERTIRESWWRWLGRSGKSSSFSTITQNQNSRETRIFNAFLGTTYGCCRSNQGIFPESYFSFHFIDFLVNEEWSL